MPYMLKDLDMSEYELEKSSLPADLKTAQKQHETLQKDAEELGKLTLEFVSCFYPAYIYSNDDAVSLPQENSLELLNSFCFYKICECKFCDVDDPFVFFASKMQKLFTAAYSINREVCYGIVSSQGKASLVLGVDPSSQDKTIPTIMEGLLPGVKLEKYCNKFCNERETSMGEDGLEISDKDRYVGCISGIPALKINGEYQHKDLSPLMRSLNGQNYTIMVMCKPIATGEIQNLLEKATRIKDSCFAISKRTLSQQSGYTVSKGQTESYSESHGTTQSSSSTIGINGGGIGGILGGIVGGIGGFLFGGPAGALVGGMGGSSIGGMIGGSFNLSSSTSEGASHSISKGYSDSIEKAINRSASVSSEVQNGFALELMAMADLMINRLKSGRSIGMWKAVTSFSSDSEFVARIIQGNLYSEIASGIPEMLPPITFGYRDSCRASNLPPDKIHAQQLMIPKGFFSKNAINSPLNALVTSEELCAICTIPTDNTIGFELHQVRSYALNYALSEEDHILGAVCEYDRPLANIPFGLSDSDLNKHTLVCGITGCGKTNTVKKILSAVDKPFLVVEPAKKEYRNIQKENVSVYTLGKPEINCLRFNPFYIPFGVSPQQHIDLLKDLFTASFALYGPMPYILEKCLHNVYSKKGWDLTLGFHPYMTKKVGLSGLFDVDVMQAFYSMQAHSYLFPTMQDLKEEVARYIRDEMTYEGEVKGNIEGAIKARIDSLCVGSKGYIFNTREFADFERLLSKNTVIELEGLADDADKAFALGLIIIRINEYRQVRKELDNDTGLKHLLVIEEAHRLLKNVSTENNEDLGNPKGKAVEHFTNLLAEMRSYGQGVIIAEQIPSKLAPEVIKNSSNKIAHRIVAKDDQTLIANAIGVYPEDAIYLGASKVGYALCHKEGMIQPVIVKIEEVGSNSILDVKLYEDHLEEKMFTISKSAVQNNCAKEVDVWAIKVLTVFLCLPDYEAIYKAVEKGCEMIDSDLTRKGITLIPSVNKKDCIRACIAEAILALLVTGEYSNHKLPNDALVQLIFETVNEPTQQRLKRLREAIEDFYGRRPEKTAVEIVAAHVSGEYVKGNNIDGLVESFLAEESAEFKSAVYDYLKKGTFGAMR